MRSAAHADASRRWGGLIVRSPEHAESPSFLKPHRSHERGRRPPCPLRQRANSVSASGRARSVIIPRRPAGPFHGSGTRSKMLGNSVRSPSDSNGAQSAITARHLTPSPSGAGPFPYVARSALDAVPVVRNPHEPGPIALFFDLGRLPGRLVNQVIDLGPYQVLDDSRAEGVEFPAFAQAISMNRTAAFLAIRSRARLAGGARPRWNQ